MELSHCNRVVESESSQSRFDFNKALKVVLCNLVQMKQAQKEACFQRYLKNKPLVWTPPASVGIAELSVHMWSITSDLVSC